MQTHPIQQRVGEVGPHVLPIRELQVGDLEDRVVPVDHVHFISAID